MAIRIMKAVLIAVVSLILMGCRAEEPKVYDYLVIGGMVFDGTGSSGRVINIAISDGKISYLGEQESDKLSALKIIDATGLVVAPGFIDPHTHSLADLRAEATRQNISYLTQGVTTVFNGNDGVGTPDVGGIFDEFAAQGIGTNVALYVGHGAVRRQVMASEKRAPDMAEMQAMKDIVRQAMVDGAFGLSSGLYYAPGSFATTEEVTELAAVAAEYCGVYDSHIRDESSYSEGLLVAVQEAIDIGKHAGVPTHISHIKALGVDVHGQSGDVITLIETARAEGLDVTADQYPWLASGTSIAASLVPRWVMDGGADAMKARLADAELESRIWAEMQENMRRRGGAASLLIVGGKPSWQGKTLAGIASEWQVTPIAAAVRIILAGDAGVASFNMNEADVINFMRQPWVMTGSDGSDGHPRKFATYPEKYRRYVVEDPVLELSDFIWKNSGLVAESLGLEARGYLKPGYWADIVIFNPETYRANASYQEPEKLSSGVEYLFVNGALVIDKGTVKDKLMGRAIRRTGLCAR